MLTCRQGSTSQVTTIKETRVQTLLVLTSRWDSRR